jgi:uncharacterized protein HemX
MSAQEEKVVDESKSKTNKVSKLGVLSIFLLLSVAILSVYEYESNKKRKMLESSLVSTQKKIDAINGRVEQLASLEKELAIANKRIESSLNQIPSIESKVFSLNEMVISKLSKDKDKLNLAISYLDDSMRYIRKMATWNFALESIQLARFNLLQYPEYIEQLTAVQNKLESFNLEPWYQISEINKQLNKSLGLSSTEGNDKEPNENKGILSKAWGKLSGSVKINKVSDIKNNLTASDQIYLVKDRVSLLLETASYALLTEKMDVYIDSINKTIFLLDAKKDNEIVSDAVKRLSALKSYKSPVQGLVHDLEMIKINLLAQQEKGDE